jgi:hypothetical protein
MQKSVPHSQFPRFVIADDLSTAMAAADVIAGSECGEGFAATQDYMLGTAATLVEPTSGPAGMVDEAGGAKGRMLRTMGASHP